MDWTKKLVTAFAAVLAVAAGCSKPPYETAPVIGRVTLDGEPYLWGSVMVSPIASANEAKAGKPGFGMLDGDGRFEISTYGDSDGAVVGRHRVVVFQVEDGPNGPPPAGVPKFRRFTRPGEAFAVSSDGENRLDIELVPELLKK